MILEAKVQDAAITIPVDDVFRADLEAIHGQIEALAASKGSDVSELDVRGLLPAMIKGIAGCERGCPADAKSLIARGYKTFDLRYIEGGILTAQTKTPNGSVLSLKMFPDF
jgi:hypothetical protein